MIPLLASAAAAFRALPRCQARLAAAAGPVLRTLASGRGPLACHPAARRFVRCVALRALTGCRADLVPAVMKLRRTWPTARHSATRRFVLRALAGCRADLVPAVTDPRWPTARHSATRRFAAVPVPVRRGARP